MSHPKDILPKDENGDYHGYCESYWDDGKLGWKGVMVHDEYYGYQESYREDGGIREYGTGYWMKKKVSTDNEEGNCYIWNRIGL